MAGVERIETVVDRHVLPADGAGTDREELVTAVQREADDRKDHDFGRLGLADVRPDAPPEGWFELSSLFRAHSRNSS